MAFVVLMVLGRLGPAVGAADQQRFQAADLIELAGGDPGQINDTTTSPSSDSSSNPPALIKAPRLTAPSMDLAAQSEMRSAAEPSEADTPAPAAPNVAMDADPATRGAAALATISYPWEEILPGWSIEFLPEKSGLYGLTLVPEKRIEVYVRDSQTEALLAHVVAHELGHAIDVTLNSGPDRRAWEQRRGIGSSPWWPGNGTTDFSTGAGDFAESFAAWQVGSGSFRSTLAPPPDQAEIELLAQLAAG